VNATTIKKIAITVAAVWLLASLAVFLIEFLANEEGESALGFF
jgi:hypothetical protein